MSISKKILGVVVGGAGLAYCAGKEFFSNKMGSEQVSRAEFDTVRARLAELQAELRLLKHKYETKSEDSN